MSHYDHQTTKPPIMPQETWDQFAPKVLPLEKAFQPGLGRTDLAQLYEIVYALDSGRPSILEIRNNLVAYLNARPDKIASEK
jgi:hypothetical protein